MALVNESFRDNPKIKVTGYSGLTIEFAKQINAHVIVRGLRVFSDFEFEFRMALANQRLAGSAVETVALITAEQHTFLSSSTVREIAMLNGNVSSMVPPYVERALKEKVAQMGEQSLPNALRD
jgi:pantetheine-phosphate adenylyltransferase